MAKPMVHTVHIRETEDRSTDEPITPSVRVSLECAGLQLEAELPSLVVIDGGFHELLQWYFEDFAVHDPFHSTKATRVSEKLKAYSSALKGALLVKAIIPSPESVVSVAFQIHQADADSAIFRNIVWEALELSPWTERLPMLNSISVARVVPQVNQAQANIDCHPESPGPLSACNILAVSSRPKLAEDVLHRLLAFCGPLRQTFLAEQRSTKGCNEISENLTWWNAGREHTSRHPLEARRRSDMNM